MDSTDDLSDIAGIGDARERWLREAFAVGTFADLASLSVDAIEAKLRADGRATPSRKVIRSWLTEARKRAGEGRGSQASEQTTPPEWRPVASFVVEFQRRPAAEGADLWRTAVHHLEEDRDERWSGIDCHSLCRWMTRHLEDRVAVVSEGAVIQARAPVPAAGKPSTAAAPRAVSDLHGDIVDGDGNDAAAVISIDKPWWIAFAWSLEGETGTDSDDWRLDVIATPVGPGMPVRLASGPLAPESDLQRRGGGFRYRHRVERGILTSAHVDTPYRLLATLRLPREGRIHAVGIADLGVVRFYEPMPPAATAG